MTGALATAGGAALVAVVLREVFHTLFHPSGRGGLSMLVFRALWRLSGPAGERARALAGPVGLVSVIALWANGLIVGFALIYWPALPGGFILASPLEPGAHRDFADAVYLSWVAQSTLGLGDIAPRDGVLRLVVAGQATIGFSLLTAAVTWVLSTYPALRRQRSAAARVHGMREAHRRAGATPAQLPPATLARQLAGLAESLTTVRVDFELHPATFYFAAPEPTLSLAHALPHVVALARADDLAHEARGAAVELAVAIEQLAALLGERYLGLDNPSTSEALDAYIRHATPGPGGGAAA